MRDSRGFSNLAVIVPLAAAYFVAGKLGLMLAFVHASATAVWPPAGITLAALLILGYRVWPGIFLGAFLVNITTAGSAATSLGIAAGNTLEGLAGAYLVGRYANGRHAFDRAQDILKFAGLAGLLSTTISATFGVTSLSLGGFSRWADYGSIWWTWWLGDVVGNLVVAPLLVLWSAEPRMRWRRGQVVEAALLLLLLLLVGQTVFGGWPPLGVKNYPVAFVCFPVLMWAALRFGQRETATAIFVLSGIAIWGTLRGFGPFARDMQNESLLLLQAFLGVAAVMTITIAALVSERRQAEEAIQALNKKLAQRLVERTKALRENEEERAQIAHEVHDELGQSLTGLQLGLSWLTGRLYPDQQALRQKTQSLSALVDATIQAVRRIATSLRPAVLDDLGLIAALEWQAREFEDRAGIQCRVASNIEKVELDKHGSTAIFRILQEALTNVARHAGATAVAITFVKRGMVLTLEVQDNGKGFAETDLSDRQTLGLLGMRERAHMLGGEVTVSGLPEKGTTVTVRIPLSHAARDK